MGVNQMHELRRLPLTEPITGMLAVTSVLLSVVIGLLFSLSKVFSFDLGIALAGNYAAPGLVFFLGLSAIWAMIWFWHYRFLPRQTSWFRHEDPDHTRMMELRTKRMKEERDALGLSDMPSDG